MWLNSVKSNNLIVWCISEKKCVLYVVNWGWWASMTSEWPWLWSVQMAPKLFQIQEMLLNILDHGYKLYHDIFTEAIFATLANVLISVVVNAAVTRAVWQQVKRRWPPVDRDGYATTVMWEYNLLIHLRIYHHESITPAWCWRNIGSMMGQWWQPWLLHKTRRLPYFCLTF